MNHWHRYLLITLACGQVLLSAGQGFMRRYDVNGQFVYENGFSIEATNYGALVVGASSWIDYVDSIQYPAVTYTLAIDHDGEPLDTNSAWLLPRATFPGVSNSLFPTSTGLFGVGGGVQDSTSAAQPVLYLFDSLGVLVNMIEYQLIQSPGDFWAGQQGQATDDGGFIIVGETAVPTGNVDPYLMKIDDSGVMEWVHWYGDITKNERARTVVQGSNGGFYIGGRRDDPSDWVQYVIHVDSLGNELWDMEYNDPNIQGAAQLTGMANGDLLMASRWRKHPSASYPDQIGMRRLDASGTVLWSKQYGPYNGSSAGLFVAKELSNGDIIGSGFVGYNGFLQGTLIRTNGQGDSLWMREYQYYDSLWTQGRGNFADVAQTQDGGFIAVGTAFGNSNNPNDQALVQYSQDTWIVKVDSAGCLIPGCDSLHTGISAQVTNLGDAIKVFPNPISVNGTFNVELKIPEAYQSDDVYLTLLNSIGQRIEEILVTDARIKFSAPADAGLYYLHLTSGSTWLAGKKVVVE